MVDRLKGLIDSCCATGCLSGIRDYDINASMGLSKSVDVHPGVVFWTRSQMAKLKFVVPNRIFELCTYTVLICIILHIRVCIYIYILEHAIQ